jgi:hypothetical protein
MRQQGTEQPVEAGNEVMARLAAAELLAQGQESEVPVAMAERIERRVRARIQQVCFAVCE